MLVLSSNVGYRANYGQFCLCCHLISTIQITDKNVCSSVYHLAIRPLKCRTKPLFKSLLKFSRTKTDSFKTRCVSEIRKHSWDLKSRLFEGRFYVVNTRKGWPFWLVFKCWLCGIADPIRNPQHLQTELFLTIENPDTVGI